MGDVQRYRYYVVYFVAATATKGAGIGRCFTSMGQSIETAEDIEAVQHSIEADNSFLHNQVTILDWKRIH